MLTFEEIKRIAFKKLRLPDDANILEIACHTSMAYLFRDFELHGIDRDFAAKQTAKIQTAYERDALIYTMYADGAKRYNALEQQGLLTAAEKNGCEICREIVKILDGRTSSC